jgi:WD40 repeat protein/serine/threonine protein kinase
MPEPPVRCPHCQTACEAADGGVPAACVACGAPLPPTALAATASAPRSVPATDPSPAPPAQGGTTQDQPRAIGPASPLLWAVGDVILGLYEVREVHEGGMGLVYRMRHRGWDLDLAVKSPRPDFFLSERDKENFEREAETWVQLGLHPHTASCYYVRRVEGIPLIFAEYVAGGSLAQWIRSCRLYAGGPADALARVLDVAIQFAWGLHHAHAQGFVHQDAKPANLLLTPGGTAKVTDFGLSRARAGTAEAAVRGPQDSILVSTGGMTPAYCSPEQARREPVSRRTDVWSWAVSVLELFTGGVTWTGGEHAPEVLEQYLEAAEPTPPLPVMPAALAELLRRCFRREPRDRPTDMLAIAEELRDIYRDAVGTPHRRPVPQPAQPLADLLNNRAVSLLDLGREEAAEQLWEEALRLEPLHPESTYNRGLLHWRRGRLPGAALVRQLREVSASHPGEWLPRYLLAEVHLEQRDVPAADLALQEVRAEDAPDEVLQGALEAARERLATLLHPSRTLDTCPKPVAAVCLNAEGTLALAAGADGTVHVWELPSGRLRHSCPAYSGAVTRLALVGDGRHVLAGGADGSVRLWDLTTGDGVRVMTGHDGPVNALSVSDGGRLALSGGEDGTFRLWRVATGECLATRTGPGQRTEGALLCAEGQWVLSVTARDHLFQLWDLETDRCHRLYAGHRLRVAALALSGDERLALSGSWDGTLKLWDVVAGECLRTLTGHPDRVLAAALSGDGKYAFSGGEQGTLRFWDTATGECLRAFDAHQYGITGVALSGTGEQALSASADRQVKLWPRLQASLAAPSVLCRVQAPDRTASAGKLYARSLVLARRALAEGDLPAAARHVRQARGRPGYARHAEALAEWMDLYLWLPRTGLAAAWEGGTFTGHRHAVTGVALSLDGAVAVSGSKDRSLKVWDVPSGRCRATLRGHEGSVWSVCVSDDGRRALSGSQDQTVKLWDLAAGRCLRTYHGHKGAVWSVCRTADGRFAWSASWDGTVRLWEAATGRCLRTLRGHEAEVNRVALSPDERLLLSASWDGTLGVWEAATGRCRRRLRGHGGPVWSACWSPEGTLALSGGEDKTLRLWDVAEGRCLRTWKGHDWHVRAVAFSLDGRYALSGSWDQGVRVWDAGDGRCLRAFEGHADRVNAVCLSADGRYALSASDDATVRLWVLDWDLEDRELADWDDGAEPYLERFRTLHTPYAGALPRLWAGGRTVTRACTRAGSPVWDEDDVQTLLYVLGCAGYGWLRPEGVRQRLEERRGK